MNSSRANSGFSLIEVLCAVLILGIGLVGLVQGITSALASSKDSEVRTMAAFLAEAQMETLRGDGFLVAGETTGDCSEPLTRFGWRQTISKTRLDGLFDVQIQIEESKTGKPLYLLETQLFETPSSTPGDDSSSSSKANRKKQREGSIP